MKLVVVTDVHANLPALDAVLNEVRAESYDALVHLGDAISIGPNPAECLDLLLALPHTQFVMGNHDEWFVYGLPQPQPSWMSDGEVEHQQWTYAQLNDAHRAAVAQWPYRLEETPAGVQVLFLHYALDPARGFAPVLRQPGVEDLDRLFAQEEAELIFYGHTHQALDRQGRVRYVNPGALGCHNQPLARYVVVQVENGHYTLEHRAAPYDIRRLYETFETRQVPEREFIYRAFFGGLLGRP
jgi:putative phosphoesterase